MTITLTAAGCLLASVWLWHHSANYKVDAAPVGSMMLASSVLLFAASLFLFGVVVGSLTHI